MARTWSDARVLFAVQSTTAEPRRIWPPRRRTGTALKSGQTNGCQWSHRIVIPTGAQRSGGTCCFSSGSRDSDCRRFARNPAPRCAKSVGSGCDDAFPTMCATSNSGWLARSSKFIVIDIPSRMECRCRDRGNNYVITAAELALIPLFAGPGRIRAPKTRTEGGRYPR